jgi:putative phage-type endonuclease
MDIHSKRIADSASRRSFIGGSDARIIMGQDEKALIRLWQEKRGEVGPEDLSGNLIVQLGVVTEDLNRQWYERNTGNAVTDVQSRVTHPVIRWMAATLDGVVAGTGAVYEAKFMLPWSFSEEFAAEKYMAQLQHNMWVTNARMAALSIITGGGKWVEISIAADPLYQHLLLTAEKKFWRCVSFGEPPSPVRGRTTKATDRGRADRRHGGVEFVGGVRSGIALDPAGLPGARTGEDRAQGADAGGCQGGVRPRGPGQTLQGGSGKLRVSRRR